MQVMLVVALIFALVVAVFAVQNSLFVDLHFLNWQIKGVSLVLVILGSAALGALLVFLLGVIKQLKLVRHVRELENKNKQMEEALSSLEKKNETETDSTVITGTVDVK